VVEFVNADTIPHTLNINDVPGFHLLVNAQGDRVRAVADLHQPATYTYYCDLPGHRQAGMEGTINVVGPPA
jgi:plastocyanin